jgi:transposase
LECGITINRDINGARNIMIRSISEDNSPVLDSEAVKQKPMSF